jgi:hypothetical protein
MAYPLALVASMLVVAGAQAQHQGFLSQYMSNGMGASKYNGAATYESQQRVSSGDIQASTVVISNNSVQDSTESHSPLGFSAIIALVALGGMFGYRMHRTMQPGTALATTQGLEIPLASASALFDNRIASQPSTHFDPLSLVEENRCECEVKYGRIAMLAAFGFPVTQQFTPAFNGDLPSNFAFQKMWLESFCPSLAFEINGKMWTLKADLPGDLDIHSMANHKFDTYPLIMAAASSAAFAPMPANAFKGEIFGLPINLFVAFAPVVLLAVPWVLVVIAPGAIQQAKRVLKGDSGKYFGEN